ncbi:MAG: helix-turn-helix transcriptional regulator [Clostridia bacterium]|nr:helix-turn-helix transcriptional regulator [Clostridia bacterium]
MNKELFTLAEKIKQLREQAGMTQSELARTLNLTRSSVNGWEMGLSLPSTSVIVELAKVFSVSTDYLLGIDKQATLNISGLSEKEVAVLSDLIRCFRNK